MNIKLLTEPHRKIFCNHLVNVLRRRGLINRIELEEMIEEEEKEVLNHLCSLLEVDDPSDISGTVEWDEYVMEQYLMCKEIYLHYVWEEYSYVG